MKVLTERFKDVSFEKIVTGFFQIGFTIGVVFVGAGSRADT